MFGFRRSRDKALLDAAEAGDMAKVMKLIDKGADVNAKIQDNERNYGNGFSPLHLAASRGHVEIIGLLVQARANVNARASKGLTALDVANKNENAKVIESLRKHGAKTGKELKAEAKKK